MGAGLAGDDFRTRLPCGMWTPFLDVEEAASLRLVLEGTAMKAGAGKLVVAVGPLDADELAGDVCAVEIR